MSNLDTAPQPNLCESLGAGGMEILPSRDVPLGGTRAMSVRRTLPQKKRSLIGAWCFVDHYGPDPVAVTGGMTVPPHPHSGLQTVSWLFSGELTHRDSMGNLAVLRPGEMNVMTAGAGIAHSERSTPETEILHGVQLWTALPAAHRGTARNFLHYTAPVTELNGARVAVFLGSFAGLESAVRTYSPLVGAEIRLAPGASLTFDVDATFEHGVLVDHGQVTVHGVEVPKDQLAYLPVGTTSLVVENNGNDEALLLLIGGEPLGEQILMWWNFVGRDHEEVARMREQWMAEVGAWPSGGSGPSRYGTVDDDPDAPLPAPTLPNVRLKLRG